MSGHHQRKGLTRGQEERSAVLNLSEGLPEAEPDARARDGHVTRRGPIEVHLEIACEPAKTRVRLRKLSIHTKGYA